MKVVIRAGGIGSRLWPKSREGQPKQFQALLGSESMLQQTWDRARKFLEPEDIYVSTNAKFEELVQAQLPELVHDNLILEPERRDSGPAIGLETLILSQKDPNEMVIGFASDHFIGKEEEFVSLIKQGEEILKSYPDHVLCMGIRPRHPSTGLGYIRMGKQIEDLEGIQFFEVESFKEKPDYKTAQEFYKDWHYLWNANIFMWRAGAVWELYKQFAPEMHAKLETLRPFIGTPEFVSKLQEVYPALEKIAVDYLIIEPNKKLLVIPADIDWSDIGDWKEIGKIHNGEKNHPVEGFDNEGIVVQAPEGKLVATFGLKDIAIVDTGDALLVCPLNRAPEVKKIVEKLKEDKKYHKYL